MATFDDVPRLKEQSRNKLPDLVVLLYLQVLSWFFNGGNMLRER